MEADKEGTRKGMLALMGKDTHVDVFEQPDENKGGATLNGKFNFAKAYHMKNLVTYSKFLDLQQKEDFNGKYCMKDEKNYTHHAMEMDKILEKIKMPTFYSDIAELESVEVIQGQLFIDKPHY